MNIQVIKAQTSSRPTFYIKSNGIVEPTNVSIQRNDDLYTFTSDIDIKRDYNATIIEKDNIILDGNKHWLRMMDAENSMGHSIILMNRINVTIKNLSIYGGEGIYISNCSKIILDNLFIYGFPAPQIWIHNCTDSTFIRNTLSSYCGLRFFYSTNNLII